jgi:4-hydroxy-4-methyl-2-oxoglutarate aldolase
VKQTVGNVQTPVVCGGGLIRPGDVILADDDGVVVVSRTEAKAVLDSSRAREAKEAATRERLAAGELGLDIYGMREALAAKGLRYVDAGDAGDA